MNLFPTRGEMPKNKRSGKYDGEREREHASVMCACDILDRIAENGIYSFFDWQLHARFFPFPASRFLSINLSRSILIFLLTDLLSLLIVGFFFSLSQRFLFSFHIELLMFPRSELVRSRSLHEDLVFFPPKTRRNNKSSSEAELTIESVSTRNFA